MYPKECGPKVPTQAGRRGEAQDTMWQTEEIADEHEDTEEQYDVRHRG
jgi:hypothetical protein